MDGVLLHHPGSLLVALLFRFRPAVSSAVPLGGLAFSAGGSASGMAMIGVASACAIFARLFSALRASSAFGVAPRLVVCPALVEAREGRVRAVERWARPAAVLAAALLAAAAVTPAAPLRGDDLAAGVVVLGVERVPADALPVAPARARHLRVEPRHALGRRFKLLASSFLSTGAHSSRQLNALRARWLFGWLIGRMDGWMDGWMDGGFFVRW